MGSEVWIETKGSLWDPTTADEPIELCEHSLWDDQDGMDPEKTIANLAIRSLWLLARADVLKLDLGAAAAIVAVVVDVTDQSCVKIASFVVPVSDNPFERAVIPAFDVSNN